MSNRNARPHRALTAGVAMCTYNGATYVGEQLASILRQTRRIDRIVISDDGSRDDTVARVEASLKGSGVEWDLLLDGRLGITQNFARAVAACDTDIVFLSDQDDVWLPHKVQTLLDLFERDAGALLAFSDARLVDGELNEMHRCQFDMVRMNPRLRADLEGPKAFETLLRRNVVTGATVAFRRALLDDALPFVDGWLHDEWLAIMAAARSGLRCIAEPLVLYRQHGRNQCGMRPESLRVQVADAASARLQTTGKSRLTALAGRLQTLDDASFGPHRALLHAAQRFAGWREVLPERRWQRAPLVSVKLLTGQYTKFADGLRSAAKDILATR